MDDDSVTIGDLVPSDESVFTERTLVDRGDPTADCTYEEHFR